MIAPDLPDFDKYDEHRLHMECLLKAPLIDFDFSLRILIPLEKAGIRTLGDLTSRSRSELLRINQLGRLSVDRLEAFLSHHLLSLRK